MKGMNLMTDPEANLVAAQKQILTADWRKFFSE